MLLLPDFLTENQYTTSPYGDTYHESSSDVSLHLITVQYDETFWSNKSLIAAQVTKLSKFLYKTYEKLYCN
jgi:hypothetical protein